MRIGRVHDIGVLALVYEVVTAAVHASHITLSFCSVITRVT